MKYITVEERELNSKMKKKFKLEVELKPLERNFNYIYEKKLRSYLSKKEKDKD